MTHDFYAGGAGDRLVDPDLYPPRIHELVGEEAGLLDALLPGLGRLVEVGSMEGLHLDWAVARRTGYLGLDIVERYVRAGRRRVADLGLPPGRYGFRVCGAEHIARLGLSPEGGDLAFFPFNSFGNITDLAGAVNGLAAARLPFVISSYRVSAEATRHREEYYRACRYRDVAVERDDRGVRFTSPDGLDTIAYDPAFLVEVFAARGIEVRPVEFGEIGLAYCTPGLAAPLRAAAGPPGSTVRTGPSHRA
ncbi:hypothetical protein ACFY4C_41245 [Actinomadura viridis]|uniref:hypothetical protein n=1 Tax=Actinomadura viridis TaxID=58110 RepID=UPI0036B956B0